ncbi:12482_t:CDS:1 [Funneliformis mosseae]|uniref:12482_t:CDS:1 n=1 Tax=Funneliformis mosseae TaxID=27381 RepID=A0A9N8VSS7_FUNMO|nr:12482_t:CDS:1 [Funneliformis mosseae]
MIQDRENKLNEIQTSSFSQDSLLIKRLNEEIEQLRSEKSEQQMKIQTLEMRIKLVQEDPTIFSLKNELAELKTSEFRLQQKVHDLEQHLNNAQEKYQQLQLMRNELKVLKESESGQTATIFRLQIQLQETKEAKETVIREWECMKENFYEQTKLVTNLEGGLQTMMEELNMAKENHAASLKELDGMTNFLANTLEQRDEDEKKIEALEAEIHSLKEGGMVDDKDYKSLRKELSNTKNEMTEQNKLLIELEKQVKILEKERDQYVERTNQLTRTIVTQEMKQKEAIAAFEFTISDLQSQLEESKSTAQTYQDTMTTLGGKLTKVESQLDESKASDQRRAQMVNEFKTVLKEANSALLEKEKMITEKNARLMELEEMVNKAKTALELSKSLESERVKELQSKVAEVGSSSELQDAQKLADRQLEYIRELEITCDHVKNLTIELEELKVSEAEKATLIENLETALKKKEEKLQDLTNILDETRAQLEKVKNSEIYSIDYVESLESQLQEARERRDEEIIKLKQANVEIEALRKQCVLLQNEAKVNNERIEELEQKSTQFIAERNEAIIKNGILESKIHKLQRDFDSLTTDFEDVANKFSDSEIRVDEHKERISQLESVLEAKELEAKEQTNEAERNKADQIVNSGQDGIISTAHLETQENESRSSVSEIQELNKKIAELEEENDGKTQLIEMLEETLKESEEELSEAKQKLNILRREKLDLERKIENLKYQLVTVTNEYEEMITSVKEKEEIEKILAEERELKKKVEIAYAKLESQVEQLLSKKNKFMCF